MGKGISNYEPEFGLFQGLKYREKSGSFNRKLCSSSHVDLICRYVSQQPDVTVTQQIQDDQQEEQQQPILQEQLQEQQQQQPQQQQTAGPSPVHTEGTLGTQQQVESPQNSESTQSQPQSQPQGTVGQDP